MTDPDRADADPEPLPGSVTHGRRDEAPELAPQASSEPPEGAARPEVARRFLALGLRSASRPAEVVAARLGAADGAAWLASAIDRTLGIDEQALLGGAPSGAEFARWVDQCRAQGDDEDAGVRLDAAAAYFMVVAAALSRGHALETAAPAGEMELALEELERAAPEAWRPMLAAALRGISG